MSTACRWGPAAEEGGASRRAWAPASDGRDSARRGSADGGSLRGCSARDAAVRRGAARRGSAGAGATGGVSARAGSVRSGSAGAASARAGSARGGSARAGSGLGTSAINGSAGRILARPLLCAPDFFLRGFLGSAAPESPVADEGVNLCIVSRTQSRFGHLWPLPVGAHPGGRGSHCVLIWCRSRERRGCARPNSSLQVRRRNSCHCWRLR